MIHLYNDCEEKINCSLWKGGTWAGCISIFFQHFQKFENAEFEYKRPYIAIEENTMKFTRVLNGFFALTLAVGLLGGLYVPASAAPTAQVEATGPYVPGEVVVGFTATDVKMVSAQAVALAGTVEAQVVWQYGSLTLLSFAEDADVLALSAQLSQAAGVKFAEPNYIYSIPELAVNADPEAVSEVTRGRGENTYTVSVENLAAMRTVNNGRIMATYPNDPYLWTNWGWSYVGGDILSGNLTASKGVCVLDTGVDYTHPDLTANITKGYDFFNDDIDPMDDNGHGTHVAGVIAAMRNNGKGIAGVSTGRVVAVKVLGAQGWGLNNEIAAGITFCANRADVSILSMSLGGGYSTAIDNAVGYAVITKNKLVVAAAGNSNSSSYSYPAGLNQYYPGLVIAVGAIDNSGGCKASYSNWGYWVDVVAPGTDIFSTLPYSKPFWLNYQGGYYPGYDFLSGTSMATPFVAAAAARRWGYTPTATNAVVGDAVKHGGWQVKNDNICWPNVMTHTYDISAAKLLDRSAIWGYAHDASTGLPLTGATISFHKGYTFINATKTYVPGLLMGSAVLTSTTSAYSDIVNMPATGPLYGFLDKAGYTLGKQLVGWHQEPGGFYMCAGCWDYWGRMGAPQKSSNFTAVTGWVNEGYDLDANVWLPNTPNPLDGYQPAPDIVGYWWSDFGTLLGFPFAKWTRGGGSTDMDWVPLEVNIVRSRKAHGTLATNPALPYYPGYYYFGIKGFGLATIGTAAPYSAMWKDGKMWNETIDYSCSAPWWFPWELKSGTTGVATLNHIGICTTSLPYDNVNGNMPGEKSGISIIP
jgi:subtilisin family serine protease